MPSIGAESAIERARDFLQQNGLDLDDRHSLSVRWRHDITTDQWDWLLVWMTSAEFATSVQQPSMRGGAMLHVTVLANGEVSHSFAR